MDIKEEGSIEFWINHKHKDWSTNDHGYRFKTFSSHGVSFTAQKHPDRTFELIVDGPLDSQFTFKCPIPECDERGLHTVVTWTRLEVHLYLNGRLVETVSSLGPGAEA